jgi:hypothetical protein
MHGEKDLVFPLHGLSKEIVHVRTIPVIQAIQLERREQGLEGLHDVPPDGIPIHRRGAPFGLGLRIRFFQRIVRFNRRQGDPNLPDRGRLGDRVEESGVIFQSGKGDTAPTQEEHGRQEEEKKSVCT